VAVVVDGVYADDGAGNAVYEPRSAEEIEQLTALVRSAIGFNETRGDLVQVANLQFAERPEVAPEGTGEAGLFDFTRDDIMSGAEMLVTLLIALALVFFVMRPLLRKVLTPEQPLALPVSAEVGGPGLSAAHAMEQRLPPELTQPGEPQPPRAPSWMNNAKQLGEAQAQTLKTVGELVDENPKQAATIVRDWLGQAA
jgi:flagellar M-ring protein FliF